MIPNGFRTDSTRSPNASRAGALQLYIQNYSSARTETLASPSIYRLLRAGKSGWAAVAAILGGGC